MARTAAALLLSVGLLGSAAGCGFDAQLLKPYTPSDGTNLDVGADNQLTIRNLVIVARSGGQGVISTSVVSAQGDQLTGVAVVPSPLQGTPGPPVTAQVSQPVELPPGKLVVLTDGPLITLQSPQVVAGGAASVTMEFAKQGQVVLNCPVVDGSVPPWSDVTASPTPSVIPSTATG